MKIFQKRQLFSQSGSALVFVLIVLAVTGILFGVMSQRTVNSNKIVHKNLQYGEVEALRLQIRNQVDCRASLNVTTTTTLPISCGSNITLKRRDLSNLTTGGVIGAWTISASCNSNALRVTATRSGVNPLTGAAWGSVNIIAPEEKICAEYFALNSSCTTSPYNIYRGNRDGSPECCRVHEVTRMTGGFTFERAQCLNTEYATGSGGVRCSKGDDFFPGSGSGYVFTITPQVAYSYYDPTSGSNILLNQWGVDCAQHIPDSNDTTATEAYEQARVLCCPREK